MRIEEYLELSKDQLTEELERMGYAQRAKFDAKLSMLCALTTRAKPITLCPFNDKPEASIYRKMPKAVRRGPWK